MGQEYWPESKLKPLTIVVYFLYLVHRPWELWKTPASLEMGKYLQRVQKDDEQSNATILQKSWGNTHWFECLPQKVDEGKFMQVRIGDMWSCPFQCEWC